MATRSSSDVSSELWAEFEYAYKHPREIFGYANFGPSWPGLNKATAGIHTNTWSVLASRPKVGKSYLCSAWVPEIALQAREEGKGRVVRVITLETTTKTYQRRMAAILAGIPNPRAIRAGTLSDEHREKYRQALNWLSSLPIEYISNEKNLNEEEALLFGNSSVTLKDIRDFIQPDTYWWVLDHMGLVSELRGGDTTTKTLNLANDLQRLANQVAAGLTVTHLTRASMGGGIPSIESISGSDQVGKNADVLLLLQRPYFEARNLTAEDLALVEKREPALLVFQSRDEGGGIVYLVWDKEQVAFYELDIPDGKAPLFPGR